MISVTRHLVFYNHLISSKETREPVVSPKLQSRKRSGYEDETELWTKEQRCMG